MLQMVMKLPTRRGRSAALPCGPVQRHNAGMTRDDPASRFDLSVTVPPLVRCRGDSGPLWSVLPGPVDRVLVAVEALDEANPPGVAAFEQQPEACGWPLDVIDNPVWAAANQCASARGARVRVRLEKGVVTGTGCSDQGAVWAVIVAICAATGKHSDVLTRTLVDEWGARARCGGEPLHSAALRALWPESGPVEPLWTAAAAVFVDEKAQDADFADACAEALSAGAMDAFWAPPSVVILGCADASTASKALARVIELLSWRGIWSRGRAGELAGRELRIEAL